MSQISVLIVVLSAGIVIAFPQNDVISAGFSLIGQLDGTFYYLSNLNDKRSIYDARTGCHDSFHNGKLVLIETDVKHNDIRRRLSSWGVTDRDRVWTTGENFEGQWYWYDFKTGEVIVIEGTCSKPWVTGDCDKANTCLAIGGRDLSYRWQSSDCDTPRRYLCEYSEPDDTSRRPDTFDSMIDTDDWE